MSSPNNKESSYHVRNNIWPKSTALPYLENFSKYHHKWRHALLRSKLWPSQSSSQEMRENRGTTSLWSTSWSFHLELFLSLGWVTGKHNWGANFDRVKVGATTHTYKGKYKRNFTQIYSKLFTQWRVEDGAKFDHQRRNNWPKHLEYF